MNDSSRHHRELKLNGGICCLALSDIYLVVICSAETIF